MARTRTLIIPLSLLGLVLLGTVIVLSSVSYYLAIDASAYLTELEVPKSAGHTPFNATQERIPRIIHQTWKTDVLPERWKAVSQTCRNAMPDYEYVLWTDASSRDFIAKEYSWFLSTFDSYTYPIQRADAIRYFVLHHFGGVYLDLDVECLRPLDPLLVYPVILPKTIPVGVSNDLMFAAKGHPFMAQTIHNLITFDHNWVLNYPTVMFSTGPMFLSAQYGLWTSSNPISSINGTNDGGEVRILSKALYGKNASPEEAPNSFFAHHYGSSWHADDAAFVWFLGIWGRLLMQVGAVVLAFGLFRMFWFGKQSRGGIRRHLTLARYDLLSDRRGVSTDDEDRRSLDVGLFTFMPPSPTTTSAPSSPTSPVSLLPLPFDLRPASPALSTVSNSSERSTSAAAAAATADALRRAGTWVVSVPSYLVNSANGSRSTASSSSSSAHTLRPRSSPRRSFVAYLPAIFTPAPSSSRRHRSSSTSSGPSHEPDSRRPRSYSQHELDNRRYFSHSSGRPSLNHLQSATHLSAPTPTHLDALSLDSPDLIDLEAGSRPPSRAPSRAITRPATPLTGIDTVEGSDVLSTRSDSISVAVNSGGPPPYRKGSHGSHGSLGSHARSLSLSGMRVNEHGHLMD